MEFLQSIDYLKLLYAYIVGGIICIIAQILIDKTKLTSARILVLYVTIGTILGGLGIYKYLVDFARARSYCSSYRLRIQLSKRSYIRSK